MTFVIKESEEKENSMEEKEDLHEDFEAEEVLSLCNLPVEDWKNHSNSKQEEDDHHQHHHRPSSSDHQEFFEFFNDLSSEMSSAEDLIFCGKLLPYYRSSSPPPPLSTNHHSNKSEDQCFDFINKKNNPFHRRSDSMIELQRSQSVVKGRFMRNSFSLDYRKLERTSSSKKTARNKIRSSPVEPLDGDDGQITAGKCFGKCDLYSSKRARPRWNSLFMNGIGLMMKTPPEMELRDIKSRQNRRNPSSMFNHGETVSVKGDGGGGGGGGKEAWSVLRALGCKGDANVVVTPSLRCIPQHV